MNCGKREGGHGIKKEIKTIRVIGDYFQKL